MFDVWRVSFAAWLCVNGWGHAVLAKALRRISRSVVGGGQETVQGLQRRVVGERAHRDRSQVVRAKIPDEIGRGGIGYLSEKIGS